MGRYLGKRLISTIPLLLVISFVVFMFIHMIPGDPARLVAGQDATKEDVAVVREHLCPVFTLLYRQYFYGIAAISDQAARFMFFAACSQTNYLLC